MWFGWLGFNGGSALSANIKAAQSTIVTNVATSADGLTYLLLVKYIRFQPIGFVPDRSITNGRSGRWSPSALVLSTALSPLHLPLVMWALVRIALQTTHRIDVIDSV
jgi:hypothetical protein